TFDKSWDCIQAVLNSSYPGKRVSTGGQVAWTSLLSGSNLFFPYRTEMIPFLRRAEMPVCEFALFMDFFPIGTLFAIYAMIKRKRVEIGRASCREREESSVASGATKLREDGR